MDQLETLLRKEFDEQARSVPESAEPWRDLQRRLSRRRALAAGTAAAALLVAVAVVVPLTRKPAPAAPATTAPASTTATSAPQVHDHRDPLRLAEAGRDRAWVATVGDRVVCVAVTQGSAGIDPEKEDCEPDAADDSTGHHPVRTRSIGSADGPFGHLLLLVGDQGVHDLSVQRGDGSPAALRLVGTSKQRQFWVADFGGNPQGFGFSGIDAHGQHFSAIT